MAQEINEATLDEIKSRTDLGELIASYGIAVKNAGSSLKACCPFHHEKTPSFNINPSKGFYHCFGCGESGDAIKFVRKYEGLSFVEAVKKLAGACGIEIKERENPEAGRTRRLLALTSDLAEFYHKCLKETKEAAIARDYLAGRRLDEKAQRDFTIGYAPAGASVVMKWAERHGYTPEEMQTAGVVKLPERPGDTPYHRFAGRLMFTIRDRMGRAVAFSGRQLVEKKNSGKYVNSPETPIFRKGQVLFGFDRAAGEIARSPHREIICCEGQIDTIRLHVCGFATAVASQGTAFTEDHAKMVKRVADAAVLMYDDDAAGHKAAVKVASMLLAMEMPVRVVSLPDGDDPDSYLLKHRPEELRALIDAAESVVSFQCRVERAKEARPDSIDAVSRVSRAVLATIAACPGAVLRSSLVAEASRILSIPTAALLEDLGKVKAAAGLKPGAQNRFGRAACPQAAEEGGLRRVEDNAPYQGDESRRDGRAVCPQTAADEDDAASAASAEPPPERESAFMGFLLANENDAEVASVVAAMLPPDRAFVHAFTRDFTRLWLDEAGRGDGEDLLGPYHDGLAGRERAWYDAAIARSSRTDASAMGGVGIARDFVRSLWCDALKRERGALPASGGDAAAVARRMKISLDLKRLQQSGWDEVEKIVSELKKEESTKGENTQWT